MGNPKNPQPVKLICGLIAKDRSVFDLTCRILSKRFGIIDFKSQMVAFNHTDHYQKEMGVNLKRQFISFQHLAKPEWLIKVKCFANRLEKKLSAGSAKNNRQINIDPGYISAGKLVLATNKNHQHRIYLGKGIYAEVTLCFTKGYLRPYQWTYLDYRTEAYITIFNKIRNIYLTQHNEKPK